MEYRKLSTNESQKQFGLEFNGEATVYEFNDKVNTKVFVGIDNQKPFIEIIKKHNTTRETFNSMFDAIDRAKTMVKIIHRMNGTGPTFLNRAA